MTCVTQPWTHDLSMMQQTVLIAAVRGPDGLPKNHIAKFILRWLRRCTLYSAMDGKILTDPWEPGGGSFTGPWYPTHTFAILMKEYLQCVDEIPHHFHLHLMHAAEILGYKHPTFDTHVGWSMFYEAIVADAHLFPESEADMDKRLGDNEADWRAREVVTARNIPNAT